MTEGGFDPASLVQSWPKPSKPRPIVTFGAGSIVGDAHFPAYRKAGFPVAGLYDPDHAKAEKLAEPMGRDRRSARSRKPQRSRMRSSTWRRRRHAMPRC